MSKTKKIIIGSVLGCILIICISLGIFYIYKLNKVLTVLTIDINPSLKLSLNYKDDIIKAEGLNADGEILLKEENFIGDDLEDAIEEIVELTLKKGYITEENNYILVNVEGKDIKEKVVTLINNAFREENVDCNVIIQEINEDAKANALKYGISESKASYIEEIIKENEDISFEELKDKSINEINKYIESKEEQKQEEQEEQKEEENKQETTTNSGSSNTSNNNSTTSSYVCPSSSANTNNVWCDYKERLSDLSFSSKYDCPMSEKKDYETLRQIALSHLGIDSLEARGTYNYPQKDSRSSYCTAEIFVITTTEARTTITFDSVTGKIIEETKEAVPTPKVSEDEAVDILLKHFNLSRDDVEMPYAWWETDGEGGNFVYRYSVHVKMNDGSQHAGSVNAMTGELYSVLY